MIDDHDAAVGAPLVTRLDVDELMRFGQPLDVVLDRRLVERAIGARLDMRHDLVRFDGLVSFDAHFDDLRRRGNRRDHILRRWHRGHGTRWHGARRRRCPREQRTTARRARLWRRGPAGRILPARSGRGERDNKRNRADARREGKIKAAAEHQRRIPITNCARSDRSPDDPGTCV